MKWLVALILLTAGIFASAKDCRISHRSEMELSGPNFIRQSGKNEVIVVETPDIPSDVRQQAIQILNVAQNPNPRALLAARMFVSDHQDLSVAVGSNALVLTNALMDSKLDYVADDLDPQLTLGLMEFSSHLNQDSPPARESMQVDSDDYSSLLKIAVSAVAYARTQYRPLFNGIDFVTLPKEDEKEPAAPRIQPEKNLKLLALQKRDSLEKKFEKGRERRTLARFLEIVKELESPDSPYARMTPEQVKAHILPHFWTPAKTDVSEWIDAELAARGHAAPEPSGSLSPMGRLLIRKKGRGMVFVTPADFKILQDDLACR